MYEIIYRVYFKYRIIGVQKTGNNKIFANF